MAIIYSTGPAYFFVAGGTKSPTSALFLGTAEVNPKFRIQREFTPVFNDIGGRKVPFELIYEGQQAFIFSELNRYNESVYAACADAPTHNGLVGNGNPLQTRGANAFGEIGTLMLTESKNLYLIIVFPYASKAVFSNNNMPLGYIFPGSVLRGPDDHTIGTGDRKISLIFQSIPIYNFSDRSFRLYREDLPALTPN